MADLVKDGEIDWEAWFAAPPEAAYVQPASHWAEQVAERFSSADAGTDGLRLPWPSTEATVRLRPGELSLWAGISGHGKSLVIGQTLLSLMTQKARCCIASLEMPPVTTLHRMVRQAVGPEFPTRERVHEFHDASNARLWLYDQLGTVQWKRMVALGRYLHAELGIEHLVIDSLMKCGIAPDDYGEQKRFLSELTALAQDTGLHVHLVVHARKGQKETDRLDKWSIKGTTEIVDQADNCFIMWRNRRKEDENADVEEDAPDAVLAVEKQRHGEWEGAVRLWLSRPSHQFLDEYGIQPTDWMDRLTRNHQFVTEPF